MDNDFQRVKDAIDIVAYIESRGVPLKKKGQIYEALCPFHTEKSPSFQVKGDRWICRGACGVGGTVIDFVMKYDSANESEALRIVAEYARIDLGKHEESHKRLYQLLELATQHYTRMLRKDIDVSRQAMNYLIETRKLSPQIIEAARIGYASLATIRPILVDHGFAEQEMLDAGIMAKADDGRLYDAFRNRIMIPVMDGQGRVIGFNGRAMGSDQPKYKNTAETALFKKSKILYTLREKNTQGRALDPVKVKTIVEGPFDALSGLMRGFRGIYAQMGSALSIDQLSQLAKGGTEKIVFCFDNDAAGESMMRRLAKEHIHSAAHLGVDLLVMRPPYGKDADDTFREHAEMWQAAQDAARPVVDVLIDVTLAPYGDQPTAAQKNKAAIELIPLLRHDNALFERENLNKLAARLGLTPAEMDRIARPQMHVMDKPVTKAAPAIQVTSAPPLETAILYGILFHEDEWWLQRADAVLNCLAPMGKDLPYALGPITALDFTHGDYQQLMTLITQDHANLEKSIIGTPLHDVYRSIIFDPVVISTYAADVPKEQPRDTYEQFVDKVLRLRLERLKGEMVGSAHFGEIIHAIGLIQQKREQAAKA